MSNLKQNTVKTAGVTIASGADTSGSINIGSGIFAGITLPANLRGVATISLLHASDANDTFVPYLDANGNAWTFTLVASSTLNVNPLNIFGLLPNVKLKGNTTASADLVIEVLIAG